MGGIRIRLAKADDAKQLVDLVLAMTAEISGRAMMLKLAPKLHEDVAAAMRGDADDRMLVAERDGRLLGCGRARVFAYHPMLRFGPDPRHAYVELMYVVREARGCGLAGRILQRLEAWAKRRGVSQVTLHHSPKARSFYERHGYALIAEMHKRLAPPKAGR